MRTFTVRLHIAKKAGRHHDLHLDDLSFAIPKGVPAYRGPKVLAIETFHRGPESRYFEGEIPNGQYGAGTSEVIDEGELQIIRRGPGHIFFKLLGDEYRGNYHLKHWHNTHWLLWKV